MPPELAAATGNHDVRTENANVGKADAGQIDPNAPPPRPPIVRSFCSYTISLFFCSPSSSSSCYY